MSALAWPVAFVIVAVLAFLAFERHASRSCASTAELKRQADDTATLARDLNRRVEALETTVTTPVTGLKDILLTMRNAQRMGK